MLGLLEREHRRWPYGTTTSLPLEHLSWKSAGPDGEGMAVRAHEDGELVALMLAFFSRAFLGGREIVRNHLHDSTTSSRHQGRGLSVPRHQTFATSERGRAPHLEITRAANPLAQSVMVRRGFRAVACPVDRFVKVLDSERFAAEWLGERRLPGATIALRAAGRLGRSTRRAELGDEADRSLTLSTLDRFGAPEDALFARVAPDFDFVCDRRSAFLNWRYLDRRAGRFVVRAARDGDTTIGYCVSLVDRGRGFIADLFTDPSRPDAAVDLLRDALESSGRDGASGVIAWAPRQHPHRAALRAAGFARLPGPVRLVYQLIDLSPDLDVFADPGSRIHFTLGDTDEV
jgi:hypothetical protein